MSNSKKTYKFSTKNELISFEQLFRLYYPRLKKYASYVLPHSNESEDLVQDVFYQIWQNKKYLDLEENASAYLFTLLKNKCLNVIRHKIVEEKYIFKVNKEFAEELYHLSFTETEDFVSIEDRIFAELENIIAELPPRSRSAFRLKWLEGKKIREIAEIMNISTTMVDKHLAKGIELVRQKLKPGLFIIFLIKFLSE